MKKILLESKEKMEIIQITDMIGQSSLQNGMVKIGRRNTTDAITINKNEDSLKKDLIKFYSGLIKDKWERHKLNDNEEDYFLAYMIGSPVTLPIERERVILGTCRSVHFMELEDPRKRKLYITELGA